MHSIYLEEEGEKSTSFLLPLFYHRPLFALLPISAVLSWSLTSLPPLACFPLVAWTFNPAQLCPPLSAFLGYTLWQDGQIFFRLGYVHQWMTLGSWERVPSFPRFLMPLSGIDTAWWVGCNHGKVKFTLAVPLGLRSKGWGESLWLYLRVSGDPERKLHEGRYFLYVLFALLNIQHPELCLAHRKHSINSCRMNEPIKIISGRIDVNFCFFPWR